MTFNQVTPRTKHASSVSSVLSEKSHEKNEHLFFIEDDRGLRPMGSKRRGYLGRRLKVQEIGGVEPRPFIAS